MSNAANTTSGDPQTTPADAPPRARPRRVRISITMSTDRRARLKAKAERENQTVARLAELLIVRQMDAEDGKPK